MIYKNSFKLMFSNGNLIWKLLLYLVVALMVVLGLSFLVALPVFNVLSEGGLFKSISSAYTQFLEGLNIKQLIININEITIQFANIIVDNLTKILPSIILFIVVFFILGSVIIRFYQLPTAYVVNLYMNSNVKQGFMTSIFGNFGKAMKYMLAYLITILPINLVTFVGLLLSFGAFKLGGVYIILMPFVILISFTLITSLKITFFSGCLPAFVGTNNGVFKSLKHGFNTIKRRFFETFGNSIALVLTLIFINVFGGVFTYGVGLIITIPTTFVLLSIFNLVAYYSSNGQRYYLDSNNVMAPKTMELTDKLTDYKYLI